MPKFLKKRWHGYYTVWAFILLLLLVMFVTIYNWTLGLISLILASALGIVMIKAELAFRRELNDYINGLSIRIKRMEGEAVSMLPFGIVLYSEDRTVEWHNRFVADMFQEKTMVGNPLQNLFPKLPQPKEKRMGPRSRPRNFMTNSNWMIDFMELSITRRSGMYMFTKLRS